MIFDWDRCCAAVAVEELQGLSPLFLGDGLWVGVLSSGVCGLAAAYPNAEQTDATARDANKSALGQSVSAKPENTPARQKEPPAASREPHRHTPREAAPKNETPAVPHEPENAAAGRSGDVLLGAGPLRLVPDTPCHLLAVCLTGLAAEEFTRGLQGRARWTNGAVCPGAAELVARLCDGSRTGAAASQTAYALLCELARADESLQALPPLVQRAVTAMRENYMELYGVEELSAQLGVSKCHLIRVFSAATGVSPGRYLLRTRVEAAQLLLLEREYTLEVIASLCGFSGANYLCRAFKRETGQTPAAWRAAHAPHANLPPLLASRAQEVFV